MNERTLNRKFSSLRRSDERNVLVVTSRWNAFRNRTTMTEKARSSSVERRVDVTTKAYIDAERIVSIFDGGRTWACYRHHSCWLSLLFTHSLTVVKIVMSKNHLQTLKVEIRGWLWRVVWLVSSYDNATSFAILCLCLHVTLIYTVSQTRKFSKADKPAR